MPEMNPRENDFAVTRLGQPTNFINDMIARSACQLGADVRNDAVATSEQATVLDFHVRTLPTRKSIEAGGNIDHAKTRHQVRKFPFIGDDFGDPRQLSDFVGSPRGVTAHDDDPCIRILAM
jgi:hypothetical protein